MMTKTFFMFSSRNGEKFKTFRAFFVEIMGQGNG